MPLTVGTEFCVHILHTENGKCFRKCMYYIYENVLGAMPIVRAFNEVTKWLIVLFVSLQFPPSSMTRKKKSVLKVVLSPPLKKSQLKASPSRPVPGVTGVRTRTGAAASPTTSSAKMKKGLPASQEKGTLKTYSASKTGKAITPGKLSAEDAVTTVKADTAEKPSSAKQRLETPKKDVAGGKSMANQPQKAEVEKKMIRPSTSQHIVRGMAKVPGAATVITVTPPRKDKTGLKQAVTESASMESSSVCQPSKIIWSKAQPLSPGKMGNGQIIRINLKSPEVSSLPVSPSAGSSISVLRSNPQKSIQCLDCMLILPNLEELNKHKHVCKKTIPTKIFSCFTCNTCFRSRDELNEHRRSMHLGLTVDNKQKVILQKQAAELAEMRSTARKALTGRDGGGSALSPSTMSAIQKAVDEVYAQKIEGSSPVTVSVPSPCKSAPMKLVLKAPCSNKGKMLVIPIKTGEDPDIQVKAHLEKLAASSLYKCGEKTQMISVKPKADQKVVKGEISTSESKEQAAVKAQVAKADFTETAVASAQTSTTVSVTRRQMASHPAKSKTLKASGAVKPKHTNEQKRIKRNVMELSRRQKKSKLKWQRQQGELHARHKLRTKKEKKRH